MGLIPKDSGGNLQRFSEPGLRENSGSQNFTNVLTKRGLSTHYVGGAVLVLGKQVHEAAGLPSGRGGWGAAVSEENMRPREGSEQPIAQG